MAQHENRLRGHFSLFVSRTYYKSQVNICCLYISVHSLTMKLNVFLNCPFWNFHVSLIKRASFFFYSTTKNSTITAPLNQMDLIVLICVNRIWRDYLSSSWRAVLRIIETLSFTKRWIFFGSLLPRNDHFHPQK